MAKSESHHRYNIWDTAWEALEKELPGRNGLGEGVRTPIVILSRLCFEFYKRLRHGVI
jgi:hypothetical protein